MPTSNNDFSFLPLGWRGLAYIVPSSEFGPSDQTDIDRTVFLDTLGSGARSRRLVVIGPEARAGAQGGRAGTLPPSPSGLPFVPVASRLF